MTSLLPAAALVLFAWSVLSLAGLLALGMGNDWAVFTAFLVVTLALVATRPRSREARPLLSVSLLGVASGFLAYQPCVALIAAIGRELGLSPMDAAAVPAPSLPWLLAVLVLSPLFEELLYRERVLSALRAARVPIAWRIGLASALFAAPHIHAWPLLGTFLVGILLGLTYEATGRVGFCIGLHAGLNVGSVVPPLAVPPVVLVLLSAPIYLAAVQIGRAHTPQRHALASA